MAEAQLMGQGLHLRLQRALPQHHLLQMHGGAHLQGTEEREGEEGEEEEGEEREGEEEGEEEGGEGVRSGDSARRAVRGALVNETPEGRCEGGRPKSGRDAPRAPPPLCSC